MGNINLSKILAFRSSLVYKKTCRGFTVPELLIVMAIGIILTAASVPIYSNFQVKVQLNESTTQAVQTLRVAREYSVSRYKDSAWGVLIDINLAADDGYILYKGDSYATRDVDYDRAFSLDPSLSFINIGFGLTGANIDINFSKGLGVPNNVGSMVMNHSVTGSKTMVVNSLGAVEEN